MPAPIRPNTAAATAAVRRRGDLTAAARLAAAGWTVTPPRDQPEAVEELAAVRASLRHVALSLTRFEADQLLAMGTAAEAGDLSDLLDRDGRRILAAERALNKLRDAVNTTEGK